MGKSTREIALQIINEIAKENIDNYVENSIQDSLYDKYIEAIQDLTNFDIIRPNLEVTRSAFSNESTRRLLDKKQQMIKELKAAAEREERKEKRQ